MLELPFKQLNLTRNPFGEFSAQERADLAVTDTKEHLEFLQRAPFILQFLGEKGRGKTTHLLALKQHFPNAPYCYYPEDGPKPTVPTASVLFLDETQRFSKAERLRIFKQKSIFVIASHEDHKAEFEALSIPYKTVHLQGLSSYKLKCIIESRLEASRRSAGDLPYFEDAALHTLIEVFSDDLRSILEHLYDIFQNLERTGMVKLDHAQKL